MTEETTTESTITEADRAHLHQTVSQMCDLVVELRRVIGRPSAPVSLLIELLRRPRHDHHALVEAARTLVTADTATRPRAEAALAAALEAVDRVSADTAELYFDIADLLGLPTGKDSPAEVIAAVRALQERAR
jgi:hypothetical protein